MKFNAYKIILMALITTVGFSKPFNTSFKVGLPYSSVQFLLGNKNVKGRLLTPSFGVSYFSVSNKSTYSDGEDNDIAVKFLLPRVGARLLGQKREDLNSYYIGELFMVVPLISGSDISTETKKDFRDATNLIGLTAGWGVEYFLSKSFSIGGEATFNMILHSITNEGYDDWEDRNYKNEYKTRLGATITQITFNYYFK